jgi:transcription elongation factor GreA
MTSTERIWMTPQARSRLEAELAELLAQRDAQQSEGSAEPHRGGMQQARIWQIQDLLRNAVVGEDPPDDGIAEPGMVLTVRYDDTGETETFLLGVRDADDGEIEVCSVQSPLGTALVGARSGEQRTYSAPSGAAIAVTLLNAVPYGLHEAERFAPEPGR